MKCRLSIIFLSSLEVPYLQSLHKIWTETNKENKIEKVRVGVKKKTVKNSAVVRHETQINELRIRISITKLM